MWGQSQGPPRNDAVSHTRGRQAHALQSHTPFVDQNHHFVPTKWSGPPQPGSPHRPAVVGTTPPGRPSRTAVDQNQWSTRLPRIVGAWPFDPTFFTALHIPLVDWFFYH